MDALWVGVAYLAGLGVSRLGLPPLVGYLLAGFGLELAGFKGGSSLHELAHVGVLLMLFTVGLKLRFASLLRLEVLGAGFLHLVLFALLLAVPLVLGFGPSAALFVGLGLAFSSTVLAVKLLEEKREMNAYHGRIAVGILILQDLVAVLLLAFAGVSSPTPWALLLLALPLLRPVLLGLLERSGHDELLLLLGVALALGGGALSERVGLSSELGALLLGALLAGSKQTKELTGRLWSLKEAFLVAFFLDIGLGGLPPVSLLPVGLLLLLAMPLKAILFFFLFIRFKLRARTAFIAALSLSSYGEFVLITVGGAVAGGKLEPGWASLMGVLVALSLSIAAPLNRLSHGLFVRWEGWLEALERHDVPHPDHLPRTLGRANWLIVGMGRTGGAAYKLLHGQGAHVIGMDADPARLERHNAKGRRIVYGDAEDPELWGVLDLRHIEGVLLTLPDLESKARAVGWLRQNKYAGFIAATSYHAEEDPTLTGVGVDLIFRPFAEAGERLAERALEAVDLKKAAFTRLARGESVLEGADD